MKSAYESIGGQFHPHPFLFELRRKVFAGSARDLGHLERLG
jgi:hypothetical protein